MTLYDTHRGRDMTDGVAVADASVTQTRETTRSEALHRLDEMMAHLRASVLEQRDMVARSRAYVERH